MSKRKAFTFFRIMILFTIIITVVGCSASPKMDSATNSSEMAQDSAAPESSNMKGDQAEGLNNYNKDIFSNDVERMMIYTGQFRMEVNDIQEASKLIADMIQNSNGYLINSNQSENSSRISAHFEFRVPVKSFHHLYNQIETMTSIGKITFAKTDGTEVTEEYLDLESRLKAKKVYEERLLDFLSKAVKTEDLLRISQDLNRVQEEIEQIQGRQQYLKHHADYSTLIIDMEQNKNKSAPTASTWEKSVNGFNKTISDITQVFNSLFVLLISLAPIMLLILLLFIIIWKLRSITLKRKNNSIVQDKEDKEDKEDKIE